MVDPVIPYRQYDPSLLEPVYPKSTRHLEDLAVLLAGKAGQLTQELHPIIVQSLGALILHPPPKGKGWVDFAT
jgi:hypothetical protein